MRASIAISPADEAIAGPPRLNFELPPELEATTPAEERGLRRDGVRMLVAGGRRAGSPTARSTHCRECSMPVISS